MREMLFCSLNELWGSTCSYYDSVKVLSWVWKGDALVHVC
jgi:hypothetical protein